MGLVSGLNTDCPKAPGKGGFEEKQKQKAKTRGGESLSPQFLRV